MFPDDVYFRRMTRTVLTVAAVFIVLAAMWAARDALMLIYISGLIAMGFSPLVHLIERPHTRGGTRGVPRMLAIFVVYVLIVGAMVLIGMAVVPSMLEQAANLWDRVPQHFNDFQRLLIRYRLTSHRVTLQEAVENVPASTGGSTVTAVVAALWSVGGGLFGLVTVIILSFYFLIEAESLMNYATRFVPALQRRHFRAAAAASVSKVSAWLRAQLTLAAIMGTSTAVVLAALHVPYFYVVALVAAVGETIPIVGPIIAGVSAVVVASTVSTKLALIVGAFFVFLHQLESNILVPKIMERQVGISPVAVMAALLIGGALFGLIGAILAIPTAAILAVGLDEFRADDTVDSAAS